MLPQLDIVVCLLLQSGTLAYSSPALHGQYLHRWVPTDADSPPSNSHVFWPYEYEMKPYRTLTRSVTTEYWAAKAVVNLAAWSYLSGGNGKAHQQVEALDSRSYHLISVELAPPARSIIRPTVTESCCLIGSAI
jgi:hypothetical protein